ncbi:AAA family ATPase [Streptomyces goshikiensis]|uniref:AAA family ATPase n=1 Tax=Streptomyces goshikiensis TaxID=1942 RepID=UPI003817BEF1
MTPRVRGLLALWGGNAAAVHRELLAQARQAGDEQQVPSLATLQRAIVRDLSVGERAGLRGGEAARRRFDVYGKRLRTHRNACWEGDHKRVPVRVDLEGSVVCPWVTWFIDVASKVVVGVAVTPHQPARDAVLAALRTGISRAEPYGPFGGLPGVVRVDRGKEFLCRTVERALGAFAVPVDDLPAYKPYRKGTVEALNGAVEEMLLVSLPGNTHRARPVEAYHPDPVEDLLSYPDFVKVLLDWVAWWNTEHHPAGLDANLTPLAAWEADPVPVEDVAEERLAFFALEDDGRVPKITTNGISWRRRAYIAPWMAVNTSLRELAPKLTRRIQFRSRPSTRDLRHELFHALGLQGRPPGQPIEFDRMLRGALEETHVLACDEAQWLSKMCFEYLRYLWDDIGSDLTIVFTGGDGCFEMLQSEPMLESRVYAWQEIEPMPLEEVLTVIPAFHPVWADADPDLIAMCDDEAAHGNFRAWAKITHHLTAGMKESGRILDEDLLRWSYSKLRQRPVVA